MKYLLAGLCILFPLWAHSQTITCSGIISTTSGERLSYANILAHSGSDQKVTFAISNDQGFYELKLQTNTTYEVTVSYLGYTSQTLHITAGTKDLTRNVQLAPVVNELGEVVVNASPPVVIKQDTLIYQTDAFATGKERKLRDILKKLPGVEVDKDGTITVKGKKVTKVLVENKTFFTGSSKLAVDNIPADAVGQVEVLDNYTELAFLKGLQDNQDMAMNIRLKEDKKEFVFGDVEIAGGPEKRYSVRPGIFYYSSNTTLNAIGDLNNRGSKSFTLEDYMEFEGGFETLIKDNNSSYSLSNDDFVRFLSNKDFKENTQTFGGVNLRQSMAEKTAVNSYLIISDENTSTHTESINEYITSGDSFTENRLQTGELDNFFILGKATLSHTPSLEEDLSVNSFVKVTGNDSRERIYSASPFRHSSIQIFDHLESFTLKQQVRYSKKMSGKHTVIAESGVHYQKDTPQTNWMTDQEILQGLIPLKEDTLFNFFQNKSTSSTTVNFLAKDYWQLNRLNHLYISVGVQLKWTDLVTTEYQQLSNDDTYSFSDAGFGNDLTYRLQDIFMGLEYKFRKGIVTFKPALFYHHYTWETRQSGDTFPHMKGVFLPRFSADAKIRKNQQLRFRYQLKTDFPDAIRMANSFMLRNFDQISKGNELLEDERYHMFSLRYSNIRLADNLFMNAGITYRKKIRQIAQTTQLNGLNQYNTFMMLNKPANNLAIRAGISKNIRLIRYTLDTRYVYNDLLQVVNDRRIKNRSRSLAATAKIRTLFEQFPEIELGYTYNLNHYETDYSPSQFTNSEFFGTISYALLKHFHLQADYSRSYYNSQLDASLAIFEKANASISYRKETSAWGFELSASNLFDSRLKQEHSFSEVYITDRQISILPRVVLFTIMYKL